MELKDRVEVLEKILFCYVLSFPVEYSLIAKEDKRVKDFCEKAKKHSRKLNAAK